MGNGFSLEDSNDISILNTKINKNSKNCRFGGGIYLTGVGKISIQHSDFRNNECENGGAIYATLSKNLELKLFNCTILDNVSKTKAGGIYLDIVKNIQVNIIFCKKYYK